MSISQEIESRINIVDLASRYLTLKKAGVNYKCNCPFHNEKTPSFVVSPTKNLAYCFSCHKGGGPIRFLMEIEKIEFREALQILAKDAWVELKTDYYKEHGENRTDIYEMYKIVAESYHRELFAPENQDKLEYVRGRGLSQETIEKFKIGYSGNPRELFSKLKEKGFDEKTIMDSGIFVGPGRDKFFGRIIFPIANFAGHTVAFTGRIVGAGEPKYLNSPASNIFDKSSILYGLHLAKNEISKKDFVIVVEGQMDTVSLHQAGFLNAVGISGTALTEIQINTLLRLTKNIYLCLDTDKAGTKAIAMSEDRLTQMEKILELIEENKAEPRVLIVPGGKDPDEFIKSWGDFNEVFKTSLSLIQFYIQKYKIINEKLSKEDCALLILKKIKQQTLIRPVKRDLYIKELSDVLGIRAESLYENFKLIRNPVRQSENREKRDGFALGEIIAAYISVYDFFDLFSEKFPYTSEHSRVIPSFSVVEKILARDPSYFEDDRAKAVELHLESQNEGKTHDAIEADFLALVSSAAKAVFEEEKKTLKEKFDPNSLEYLMASKALIEKGLKLGIKPNRA